ncbi:hypothetical protein [Streptomyces sp. NPDC048361]|uniref:hypothetical protein n=1 Tax=Streptomyces sp. NPDC048361 TaxID=3154720 RepID=UPI00341A762A
MNLTIPGRAADVRAAYQVGFQDDAALLAFTLPTSDVDRFIQGLKPVSPLEHRALP